MQEHPTVKLALKRYRKKSFGSVSEKAPDRNALPQQESAMLLLASSQHHTSGNVTFFQTKPNYKDASP
jgi:hypothetical protein